MMAELSSYRSKFTWKEIKDPIYNYIWFNKEVEEPLINSLLVQRLRYILQLQTAHLVYPGAVHTRFQHSIGVMHLAGRMAEDLVDKLVRAYGRRALGDYPAGSLVEAVRLAGLFHDIGHAAFGHAFEAAVLWNPRFRSRIPESVANHERIGYMLIRSIEDDVHGFEERYGLAGLWELLTMILGDEEPGGVVGLARMLIKDSLYPADILDFLQRDSYYTGTREYGYIDYERLVENTYPYMDPPGPFLVLDRKALGELRRYLTAKAAMYEHVYFHSVNRAFDKLLQEIIELGEGELFHLVDAVRGVAEGRIEDYLHITDVYMYSRMLEAARTRRDRLGMLCRQLLIERKPMWKRIGREYRLLPHRGVAAIREILSLAFSSGYRRQVAESITRYIYERIRGRGLEEQDELWTDIVVISPIPTSMLIASTEKPASLSVPIGKIEKGRIVYDRMLNLIEEGMPLSAIIRVYVRRGLYKPELERPIGDALEDAVREVMGIEPIDYGSIVESVRTGGEELGAQKITA